MTNLSRRTVLQLGILLSVLPLLSFLLGFVAGRMSKSTAMQSVPRPAFVAGRVLAQQDGELRGDADSLIMVFPEAHRPTAEERLAVEDFLLENPLPDGQHATLQALRSLGGDVSRTGTRGEFVLRVPDSGDYFLLAVSRNHRRNPGEPIARKDIAELGRYLTRPADLLRAQSYAWKTIEVEGDLDAVLVRFPP
jgi:hypothetical protein